MQKKTIVVLVDQFDFVSDRERRRRCAVAAALASPVGRSRARPNSERVVVVVVERVVVVGGGARRATARGKFVQSRHRRSQYAAFDFVNVHLRYLHILTKATRKNTHTYTHIHARSLLQNNNREKRIPLSREQSVSRRRALVILRRLRVRSQQRVAARNDLCRARGAQWCAASRRARDVHRRRRCRRADVKRCAAG